MADNGVNLELSKDDKERRDQVLHHYRGKKDDNLTPLYQSWADKYEKVRSCSELLTFILYISINVWLGPMKGGQSVGCRLKIFRNVQRQRGKESVECRADCSVKCRASDSECRCRPTLILI